MVGIGLAALLVLLAVGVEVRSVLFFRAVTPWSSPERIHFCGRDYPKGGTVSAAQAENGEGAGTLQQLTRGPLLQPIYGHPATTTQRGLGAPCAITLYVRDGDAYDVYDLAGGP